LRGSTVSRRVSEFVGVALFAAALIWIIALPATSRATRCVLQQRRARRAGELAGRVGAFLAELSFQLFGYGAYLSSPPRW